MRQELQEKLLAAAPMLYKYFKDNPKSVIDCPDDLFDFLFELSRQIIALQSIFDSPQWQQSTARLPLALGKGSNIKLIHNIK